MYVNNAQIAVSIWDVTLQFGRVVSDDNEKILVKDEVTVIMSLQHAKAFAQILRENIDKYEKQIGTLHTSPPDTKLGASDADAPDDDK